MVCNKYKEAKDDYLNLLHGKEEPNEDEMFMLISSFRKLEVFSNAHNMNNWNIWESLFEVAGKCKESLANGEELLIPMDAIKSVIASLYYLLIWNQHQIGNNTERNSKFRVTVDPSKRGRGVTRSYTTD